MSGAPFIEDSSGRVISGHPSWKGNSSGGGGDMDGRLRALESGMTDVKVSLGKIETRLDHIEKNMVTKGQIALWALFGLLAVGGSTVGGIWWMVQQYLAPILKSLPS
ncbi:hypothetical protein ACCM60_14145 [Pseudomonas chlororaphis subsp. aureofaciens]|uniref:hypothetical protein n=1 Tax=Pseudomonas chlororaphis TaxID=587753 RepID=UPI0035572B03